MPQLFLSHAACTLFPWWVWGLLLPSHLFGGCHRLDMRIFQMEKKEGPPVEGFCWVRKREPILLETTGWVRQSCLLMLVPGRGTVVSGEGESIRGLGQWFLVGRRVVFGRCDFGRWRQEPPPPVSTALVLARFDSVLCCTRSPVILSFLFFLGLHPDLGLNAAQTLTQSLQAGHKSKTPNVHLQKLVGAWSRNPQCTRRTSNVKLYIQRRQQSVGPSSK